MQNRIYKAISAIVMTVVVLLGMLFIIISYELYSAEAKSTLVSAADTALEYSHASQQLYDVMSKTLDFEVRVTEIALDGTVIFESSHQGEMDNHLDRPEITEAMEKGHGSAERYSETLSRRTYYYAVNCGDSIIRFSRKSQGISAIFIGAVPFFLVAAGLVMVIAVIVSMKLSETIMKPVHQMVKSMDIFDETEDNISDYDEYEELLPMLKLVSRMKKQMHKYIDSLTAEKNTIALITANMTEGMILLDRDDNIISINQCAIDLVNPDFPNSSRCNVIEFTRNSDFLELIANARTSSGTTGTFSVNNRFLRAFISRISSESQLSGAVILIVDETEIHLNEEVRREFSANVSHELKTPLTTIRGFAEMLSGGMIASDDDISRYGRRIYDESNRLLSVINDIIRLSEIEEKITDYFIEADLLEIVNEVAESLYEKAAEHNISIEISGENAVAPVSRGYIYELVYNLTENAVKYNRTGGKVMLSVMKAENKVIITVEDNGIGIPKEHHQRIFERFYRVDKSHSKQTGGTGLGLSIVKHITALHKGNISFESEAGRGTIFTVVLPA